MGKSTSKSKSGSKSGSRSKSQNHEDWSEWEWDEQYQREWRGRLGSDGTPLCVVKKVYLDDV